MTDAMLRLIRRDGGWGVAVIVTASILSLVYFAVGDTLSRGLTLLVALGCAFVGFLASDIYKKQVTEVRQRSLLREKEVELRDVLGQLKSAQAALETAARESAEVQPSETPEHLKVKPGHVVYWSNPPYGKESELDKYLRDLASTTGEIVDYRDALHPERALQSEVVRLHQLRARYNAIARELLEKSDRYPQHIALWSKELIVQLGAFLTDVAAFESNVHEKTKDA